MGNTKSWTTEQKLAIDDRGHNLLVSAAAGSGKTAVLVERIISLIKNDGVNIDEMLIATFTNAAASEMREKICRRLIEEKLDDQLERMGHASIGSLDSFANSIVKRYYHIIGIDSGLQTCDKTKSVLLKEDALDEMFEELFESGDRDFLYFLDCYDTRDDNDDSVREMILKLHTFLMSMPEPWEYAEKACSAGKEQTDFCMEFARERSLILLDKAIKYLYLFKEALSVSGLNVLADKAAIDCGYAEDLKAAVLSDPELGFAKLLEPHRSQNINLKKTELALEDDKLKAIRDHGNNLIKKLREDFGGLTRQQLELEQSAMKSATKILFGLVKKFDEKYSGKKLQNKSLDFSDMNHFALRILENEDVRNDYREQYKYIFIDEFQDTNSVQEAIIKSIAGENNLFMVGDVKQSIYKFRLAEPEIFIKDYDAYKSGADENSRVIDLNRNFRSKKEIINTVNTVFGKLMHKDSCDMEYDDAAALVKGNSYEGPLSYPPELRILNNTKNIADDPLVADLKKTELEALQIASIIREYRGKMIFDDESGTERPLEYRDMVVLMRGTRTNGEVIYRTLLESDIPVYLDRSEGYFDSLEIQVFINLLKIIDNRKQDIPLLSVLCCPVFGYSADELAGIRKYGNEVLGNPDADFNEVFTEYAKQDEKAGDFLSMLDYFRKESKILPLADFLYDVLLKTGYGDFASSQNGGEQKLANLRSLVDRASEYEKENLSGLSSFIRFAEILARNKRNIDIGPAKTVSESSNCVKIMTIHKSKGLEFPFVLVAGLAGGKLTGAESKTFAYHKNFGFAIKPVNPVAKTFTETKLLYIINLKKKLEERAEEIRIMYVAMTRAKDMLVFSSCKNLSDKDYLAKRTLLPGDVDSAAYHLDLIQPCFASDAVKFKEKNSLAGFVLQTEAAKENFRRTILEGFDDADDESVSEIMNFRYFSDNLPPKKKYSVSELAEKSRTGRETYSLSTGDEEEHYYEVPLFIRGAEHELSSTEKGTAYHAVMEHIPFTAEGKTEDEITAFINSLVSANILSGVSAGAVDPKKIKAFFNSDLGKRAVLSKEIHKEAPFVMRHVYEGHEVLVQGTIDCYFEEDGRYVLVDYKSNYVDLRDKDESYKHLKENYLPQLALYKEALEKLTDKKVEEAYLYLFGTGESLKI